MTEGTYRRGLGLAGAAALMLAVGFYGSHDRPRRLISAVRQAVATVVLPGRAPALDRLSAVERQLVQFVARRSWGAVVDFWLPLYRAVAGPPAWVFPVPGGAIRSGYGWVRVGGRVRWSPGITVTGPPGAPVLAATGGRMRTTGQMVILTGTRLTIVYRGVHPASSAAQVVPGSVVGHLRGTVLRLSVLQNGIPVDPLKPGWLEAPSRP